MSDSARPRSIVVGVDGSNEALGAAMWALAEAAGRGVTLSLLSAVEPGESPDAAERAVNRAVAAIEAEGASPKMDTRVVAGPAAQTLIGASASADLLCVGAVGLRHFQPGRLGSTAAAVATAAHCPVAIVRGRDRPTDPAAAIVAEIGGFADSEDADVVLAAAIGEARLRDATLHALVRGATRDGQGEADRRALANVDRRLARWTRRYPDLRVRPMVTHDGLLEHVAQHRPVQLAVVGARDRRQLAELVGPVGSAHLQAAGCSLLVVNRWHL